MPQPGADCEVAGCNGRLTVYTSLRQGDSLVRYLHCNRCGHIPADSKHTIPIEYARYYQPREN